VGKDTSESLYRPAEGNKNMTVSPDRTRPADSPQNVPVPSKDTGARAAAERVASGNSVTVSVLGLRLELPPAEQLAYLAGLGLLVALEIIEWPVAAAIAVGHALAHSHHGRVMRWKERKRPAQGP
jgi:hypothetical protein